jgi:hypothetical protein
VNREEGQDFYYCHLLHCRSSAINQVMTSKHTRFALYFITPLVSSNSAPAINTRLSKIHLQNLILIILSIRTRSGLYTTWILKQDAIIYLQEDKPQLFCWFQLINYFVHLLDLLEFASQKRIVTMLKY